MLYQPPPTVRPTIKVAATKARKQWLIPLTMPSHAMQAHRSKSYRVLKITPPSSKAARKGQKSKFHRWPKLPLPCPSNGNAGKPNKTVTLQTCCLPK
ncbi:hypothetical protein NPIL_688991 [Nephila pilipes]|uniref:Uncharacterized protein n=1 Tax=Nephila pilipes TaxID=299642 RepID=A0A8X6UCW8_NEPPI|nr:hypothetical protein NPIL_688991 [Nephila pilipes]